MFIQTESTPNPDALKFLPGQRVVKDITIDFPDATAAKRSPLVQKLFEIQGVIGVFLGEDFITVSKSKEYDWDSLQVPILSCLMEFFLSGQPVLLWESHTAEESELEPSYMYSQEDEDVVNQIKEILDTSVRPFVNDDGGDIKFYGFEKGIVYLVMRGACSSCPSSTATLKAGVENLLRYYIPEVIEVQAIL